MQATWAQAIRLGGRRWHRRALAAGMITLGTGCGANPAPLDLGMWLQPTTVSTSDGLLRPTDIDMLGPGMAGVASAATQTAMPSHRHGPCGARVVGVPPLPDDTDEVVVTMEGTEARLVQSVGRAGAATDALQRAVDADLRFGCPAFDTEREPGHVTRVDRVTPVTGLPNGATAWTSRVSNGDESAWEGAVWLRVGGLYASLAIHADHRPQPPAMRALVDTTIGVLERAQAPSGPATTDL